MKKISFGGEPEKSHEIRHIQRVRGPKYWLENGKKKHATGMHWVIDAWPI